MVKKSEFLYILFIHEGDDYLPNTPPSNMNFIKMHLTNFSTEPFVHQVKIVIIHSYEKKSRPLSQNEIKATYSKKYTQAITYSTQVLESIDVKGNIGFNKKIILNNWKDAFDFVLKKYDSNRKILHTVSHCSGFEINGIKKFSLNCFGGIKPSNYQTKKIYNRGFKIFSSLIRQNKISTYLLGNFTNPYLLKKEPKHIRNINEWYKKNNTNGLNIFDFTNYLKSKKVIFECAYFNNCNFMLLDNLLNFKGITKYIAGSTGNINTQFFKSNKIIKYLFQKPVYNNSFFDTFFTDLINASFKEPIKIRHYSVVDVDKVCEMKIELRQVFKYLNYCTKKNNFKLFVEHLYKSYGTTHLMYVSDDSEKRHVEILDFLQLIKGYFKDDELNNCIKKLNELYKNAVVYKYSEDNKYNCISLNLLPNELNNWRLSYVKNFFTSPYNLNANQIGLDIFFYNALGIV